MSENNSVFEPPNASKRQVALVSGASDAKKARYRGNLGKGSPQRRTDEHREKSNSQFEQERLAALDKKYAFSGFPLGKLE
jgi:hypothetical protein